MCSPLGSYLPSTLLVTLPIELEGFGVRVINGA